MRDGDGGVRVVVVVVVVVVVIIVVTALVFARDAGSRIVIVIIAAAAIDSSIGGGPLARRGVGCWVLTLACIITAAAVVGAVVGCQALALIRVVLVHT